MNSKNEETALAQAESPAQNKDPTNSDNPTPSYDPPQAETEDPTLEDPIKAGDPAQAENPQSEDPTLTEPAEPVSIWKIKGIKVFATNSDFLISIYFQPNAVDLRYFKLWTLLDKKIKVWNIKGLHHQVEKNIGIRKSELVTKTQFLCKDMEIWNFEFMAKT